MTTVTLLLMEKKANKNGEQPLYIRIIKKRKPKYISLGIRVHPNQWNQEKLRVKSSYPHAGKTNAWIAKKVAEAEEIAITLETKNQNVTGKKVKDAIKGKEVVSIICYMENYMSDLKATGKIGTYDKYNATLLKLKRYLGNRDLTFLDFDLQFLKAFERYLRDELGNVTNTIHGNLKIFRKLFNDAVREEIIEFKDNPFTKYRLKWQKTKTEFLTEEELSAIENLALTKGTVMYHHRNMYVFAAYAGGIRISDLLQLKWQNFDGSNVHVYTQKTNDAVSIKLPTKALSIIEEYAQTQLDRQPHHFIFPLLKQKRDYSDPLVLFRAISSNTAYANKNLKKIAEKVGLSKAMHFHTSRHTWAVRALQKGMRIEHVSKLMTHASIKTTQLYAKVVNSELDSAMNVFK
ncbi:MAG: site-specific integrase [Chitinophagaceae bacterium]|nr:MAG: site-specific integrase [Chitinophagaceae bacterium]